MNGETTTTACLCQTVDRATGTLRRLLHRIVLLCAAASYLLSLPLQVMFPEVLPLGETPVEKGGPTPPLCSVTFGPKAKLREPDSPWELGCPPPFWGTVREGGQESQVVMRVFRA